MIPRGARLNRTPASQWQPRGPDELAAAPCADGEHAATMRETVVRAIAGLFAFGWVVVPGFGAIDLAVTWSSDWPQVLEAGWGLFFTALVGAAFVLVATRPRACGPGLIQLVLTSGALAVSAAVADEPPLFWLAAALALETAIVGG